MRRTTIPKETRFRVLYLNADTCCVCRKERAQHVHHINEDPNDNQIGNLACLCLSCHSEGHSTHQLTQNLTPERIAYAKVQWEAEVQEQSALRLTSGSSGPFMFRAWCYFNFPRIVGLVEAAGFPDQTLARLRQMHQLGLTDENGIPIPGENAESTAKTIFQTLAFNESNWLEKGFAELVDSLVRHARPIELARMWKRQAIKDTVQPGGLAFLNAGMYFKKLDNSSPLEQRSATCFRGGINVSFHMDTWNVSTSSCLHLHFTGHRRVGALLLIRSVEIDADLPNLPLHITATPIAMGVGFPLYENRKPAIAYAREAEAIELALGSMID